MILHNPWDVLYGLIPSMPNETALYIAIGIIGATVMPHNLYLHSSWCKPENLIELPKVLSRL
jgi:manganese transport protein